MCIYQGTGLLCCEHTPLWQRNMDAELSPGKTTQHFPYALLEAYLGHFVEWSCHQQRRAWETMFALLKQMPALVGPRHPQEWRMHPKDSPLRRTGVWEETNWTTPAALQRHLQTGPQGAKHQHQHLASSSCRQICMAQSADGAPAVWARADTAGTGEETPEKGSTTSGQTRFSVRLRMLLLGLSFPRHSRGCPQLDIQGTTPWFLGVRVRIRDAYYYYCVNKIWFFLDFYITCHSESGQSPTHYLFYALVISCF